MRSQNDHPKRTLTDVAIAALVGEDDEKVQSTFYLPKSTKAALERAARKEGVTRNAYILRVLSAELRKNGYID